MEVPILFLWARGFSESNNFVSKGKLSFELWPCQVHYSKSLWRRFFPPSENGTKGSLPREITLILLF